MDGRNLNVVAAVSREDAVKLKDKNVKVQTGSRNLYLAREGCKFCMVDYYLFFFKYWNHAVFTERITVITLHYSSERETVDSRAGI